MAKKRPGLTDALHRAAEPEPLSAAESSAVEESTKQPIPPARQGKKVVAGYFDPVVSKQLKLLALERNTSVQALIGEALNLLFERHGKPPIA